jgi:geranylgeranyl pyrophosphate synthase
MKIWLNAIENELYRILPLEVDRKWVEMVTAGSIHTTDNHLFNAICEPAKDLVYRGGKRWRPLLMLLTANMLGGQTAFDIAQKLVSLVELPHNGSLIIDDIEDGSDLRRGKPATHITYGVDIS